MWLNDFLCPPRVLSSSRVQRLIRSKFFKILYRVISLKFYWFVSQSSLDLRLELLHLICAGSFLLRNVQQLFEFDLICQNHPAGTDPIQDKSFPKLTEPLKNISFNFEGHPFKFLLRKPSVKLALLAILEM